MNNKRKREPSPGAKKASKPPAKKQASRQATERDILRAAEQEFAERGLAGARLERIAERAEANRALVYRYFESKEGLFAAVLQRRFESRFSTLEKAPRGMGDALVFWARAVTRDPTFARLLQQESLADEGPITHRALRRAYYDKQAADYRVRAEDGQMPAELEPDMLIVALSALVSFPAFFPRMVEVMTGQAPGDPAFQERWERFLRSLSARLTAPPPDEASGPS